MYPAPKELPPPPPPRQFFQLLNPTGTCMLYPALLRESLPGETTLQDTADHREGACEGKEEAAWQGTSEDRLILSCSSHCGSWACFRLSGC